MPRRGESMPINTDYPEPEEAAEALVEHASGDGEGVLRDTLVEANSQANAYSTHMEEVNVLLDHVCDDTQGVVPFQIKNDLRQSQREAQFAAQWFDEFALKLKAVHDERFK